MAHMHLFGHIRRAEIDHDGARFGSGCGAQFFILQKHLQPGGEGFGRDREVNKPRSSDRRGSREASDIDCGGQFRSEGAGIGFQGLGEDHGGIRLIVTKPGVCRLIYCGNKAFWQHMAK